ncbi:MAG: hypothetical protein MZU95_06530 [Desulfomicrobium escambiense]|nr:hypothetical protein [Desulfomicrobium escambiense]
MTTGIDQKYAMMKYCFPADISVIPLSDSLIIMYAADVYGQIWRIRYDYFGDLANAYTSAASTQVDGEEDLHGQPRLQPGLRRCSELSRPTARPWCPRMRAGRCSTRRTCPCSAMTGPAGRSCTSAPVTASMPRYTMISNRMYYVTDTGALADETDLLNLTCDELDDGRHGRCGHQDSAEEHPAQRDQLGQRFLPVLDKQGPVHG